MFSISTTARSAIAGALAMAAIAAVASSSAIADGKNQPQPNPFEQSVDEEALNVTFFNDYASPLLILYVTNINDEFWGADLLELSDINSGESLVIDINDFSGECEYDLHAEFANGEVLESWTVDFCENNEFYYYSI